MIGRLTGVLVAKQPPSLMIDVGGVGYEVEAPMSTFYSLPELGQKLSLQIHQVIREDAHLLYGFATAQEKTLFRELIRITGVGPKLALAVLSGISADRFWDAVRNGETAQLTRVPGVGKRTAERLVMEMRDRESLVGHVSSEPGSAGKPARGSAAVEARSALEALGYKSAEAQRMIDALESDDMSAEQIIREALRRAIR